MVKDLLTNLRTRAEGTYQRADAILGGSLTVLQSAVEHFSAVRGSQAAASLTYYAFFSLFPLLLFILIAAGLLLGRERAYAQLVLVLGDVLPVGQDVVRGTIDQVLAKTGRLQFLAALGLLWSGTGFFSTLVNNVDLGWPEVKAANLIRQRLFGLIMVAVSTLLLLLSLLLNLLIDVLLRLRSVLPGLGDLLERANWPTTTRLMATGVALLLLFGLYWGVPKARVRWQAAAGGALAGFFAWNLVSWAFSRLVASGLTRYERVYGSLGAVAALLFWMYLANWIVLFGVHLTASIDRRHARAGAAASSSTTSP